MRRNALRCKEKWKFLEEMAPWNSQRYFDLIHSHADNLIILSSFEKVLVRDFVPFRRNNKSEMICVASAFTSYLEFASVKYRFRSYSFFLFLKCFQMNLQFNLHSRNITIEPLSLSSVRRVLYSNERTFFYLFAGAFAELRNNNK